LKRLNNWGLYAQDQWTTGRSTIGLGLRFDRFTAFFPASHVGPTTYMPTPLTFDAVETTGLSDLTPRLSFAYDLSGDGKTALRVGVQQVRAVPKLGAVPPLAGKPRL